MEHVDAATIKNETGLTLAGGVGLLAAALAALWAAMATQPDDVLIAATLAAGLPALAALIQWNDRSAQTIAVITLWTAGAGVTCALFGWATAPLVLAPILAAVAGAGRTDLVAACAFSVLAAVAGLVAQQAGVAPQEGAMATAFTAASIVQVGALALAAAWRSRLREAQAMAERAAIEEAAALEVAALRQRVAAAEAEVGETREIANSRARFLAEMSHELRTPLNAIIGFADAMRARLFGPMPARYGEYADLIHRSGRHLLELVGDVLDLSRIDAGRFEAQLEPFDAATAIAEAMDLVAGPARESGVVLLRPEVNTLPVEADKRAFRQMLLNLLSNAVKFTPSGGTVSVETLVVGNILRATVRDTGVGIPEEQLSGLGQPFQQAANQPKGARGVGLGLALVRRLAEIHGGTLTIDSRLGEGTAATLSLPIVRPEPTPAPLGPEEL